MQRKQLNSTDEQKASPSINEISLMTYNVWTGNSLDNITELSEYIATSDIDIICLQEVTDLFFNTLVKNHPKIKEEYDFVEPPIATTWSVAEYIPDYNYRCYDGELLLIKKKYHATLQPHVPMTGTNQNRHFAAAILEINGAKIGVGTAHIESEFYSDRATKTKAAQLEMICKSFESEDVDSYILAGDMNLTGGDQLEAEDKCIDELKLADVWKELKSTTDNDMDKKFREEDVTWDGARNTNIPDKNEFQRPDRVYLGLFREKIKPVSISRIEGSMSDHYGLKASFTVSK